MDELNLAQLILELEFLAHECEASRNSDCRAAAACITAAVTCLTRLQDATNGSEGSSESPLTNMN